MMPAKIINYPTDVATPTQTTAVYEDECVQLILVSYPIQEIIIVRKLSCGMSPNASLYADFNFTINISRQAVFCNPGLLTLAKMMQPFRTRMYDTGKQPKYINYVVNMTQTPIDKSRVFLRLNEILLNNCNTHEQFVYEINPSFKPTILRFTNLPCHSCNQLINNSELFYTGGATYCSNCEPGLPPDYIMWRGNQYTYKLKLEGLNANYHMLDYRVKPMYFSNSFTFIYRMIFII